MKAIKTKSSTIKVSIVALGLNRQGLVCNAMQATIWIALRLGNMH